MLSRGGPWMIRDQRRLPLSTDSAEAAALFDRAVAHYLKFHADTMALVGRMLAADPGFALGHCFKGYLLLSASNPAFEAEIAATLRAAEAGAAKATERERQHLAAFAVWAEGGLDRSFGIWQQLLEAYPTDLLAARICDTSWFRYGQTAKILAQADRLAPGSSRFGRSGTRRCRRCAPPGGRSGTPPAAAARCRTSGRARLRPKRRRQRGAAARARSPSPRPLRPPSGSRRSRPRMPGSTR